MNETKEFLVALGKDPQAKKLLKEMKKTANAEETAEQYLSIAEKLGYSVTKESLLGYLKDKEKIIREKTAKAESAVKEALDDETLETVAGGAADPANPGCVSTFVPGEWCWVMDSCWALIISDYTGDDLNEVDTTPNDLCRGEMYSVNASACEMGMGDWSMVKEECVGTSAIRTE